MKQLSLSANGERIVLGNGETDLPHLVIPLYKLVAEF